MIGLIGDLSFHHVVNGTSVGRKGGKTNLFLYNNPLKIATKLTGSPSSIYE